MDQFPHGPPRPLVFLPEDTQGFALLWPSMNSLGIIAAVREEAIPPEAFYQSDGSYRFIRLTGRMSLLEEERMMRCSFHVLFAVLHLSAWITAAPSVAREGGFRQDRFAIGFWVDPPVDAKMEQHYQEIADANFSLVLGGVAANNAGAARRQLHLCEKLGLKALVWSGETPANLLPNSPACWGYVVWDEPHVRDFPALRQRTDEIRRHRPHRLACINLYPNYASENQMGVSSYAEYLRRFVKEVQPDVLSMDHYPMFKPGEDGRDAYCENLAAMREVSQEAGIPFWNFFNTMPYGPHTDPTEAQLRWQMHASLAYGAKGVLYFCYYTPISHEFPKGGAIIGRDNLPTRHYGQAKRLNGEVKNLGPALMRLTSTAVIRIRLETEIEPALAGTPLKNITRAEVDPEPDLLIGVFKHEDGRRAVLLMNYRFEYTAWPTVEFAAPLPAVREIDKTTGRERLVRDDSPDLAGLQVSLDAGEGRLFLLNESP
jgi:hypothetical protein